MLQNQINEDYISAMKAKDESRVSVLRMLKSALQNSAILQKKELTDEDVIKTIQKEIKQRTDSIATYDAGGRTELATKEKAEINILINYLPKQLSSEELTEAVKLAISETGATSIKDMGKVMAHLTSKIAGRADGKQISGEVKELIS